MSNFVIFLLNKTTHNMQFVFNDGGRKKAGYLGITGDCVCRAICIATGKPYDEIYSTLALGNKTQRRSKKDKHRKHAGQETAAHGITVKRKWFQDYMKSLGFVWVNTMEIGSGCKVHLKANELPTGRIIVRVSKHYAAVIDGVLNDTHDCTRSETRCVYGYWMLQK